MSDYKVTLHREGAADVDLTEHLKVLYDVAVGSMDWGSGFLDTDDMVTITEVGEAMGLPESDMLDNRAYARQMQKPHARHDFDPDSAPDPAVKPYRPACCQVCGYDMRRHDMNQSR